MAMVRWLSASIVKFMEYQILTYYIIIATIFLNAGTAAQANVIEKKFIDSGLVDVRTVDSTIQVDLVNSDPLELYWQFTKMKIGFNLNKKQAGNRKLLSDTMKKAGFIPLSFEWWHFNGIPKDVARKKYPIIE